MNHHERIVLVSILRIVAHIDRKVTALMPTLDDIQNDVAAEATLIEGVSTLLAGLRKQVSDLMASDGIHPDTQARIDAIFAQAEANKQNLSDALAVSPAEPEPVPAPPAPATDTPPADQPTV